jgi:hypothetical protein
MKKLQEEEELEEFEEDEEEAEEEDEEKKPETMLRDRRGLFLAKKKKEEEELEEFEEEPEEGEEEEVAEKTKTQTLKPVQQPRQAQPRVQELPKPQPQGITMEELIAVIQNQEQRIATVEAVLFRLKTII